MFLILSELSNIIMAALVILDFRQKKHALWILAVAFVLGFAATTVGLLEPTLSTDGKTGTGMLIGSMEEIAKLLAIILTMVILTVAKKDSTISEMDGLELGVIVAVGCSFFENLVVISDPSARFALIRNFSSISHATYAMITGYFSVLGFNAAREHGFGKTVLYILCGLVISSLLHGLWDSYDLLGMFVFLVWLAVPCGGIIFARTQYKKQKLTYAQGQAESEDETETIM